MRRLLASIAVFIAIAAGVIAGSAGTGSAAAATKPSACQRLKGPDLAPARSVKLVARPAGSDENDLVGCVLPRGALHKIAALNTGYNEDGITSYYNSYALEMVVGRIVVITVDTSDSYGGYVTLEIRDLRSGGGYIVATRCIPTFYTGPCENDHPHAAALRVSGAGRAVAILTGGPTGETLVRAFDTLGRGRTLDGGPGADIPPQSLQLTGNLVTWTNAGVARSALLKAG